MFSKELMKYLMNYNSDVVNDIKKENLTVKEIRFNQPKYGMLAKEYVTINKK